MTELVAATANPDKLAEFVEILADTGVVLLPRPGHVPDVVEDADTLEGNARLKARAICAATGLAAVADDTGLEVDALGGRPGVWSARYAGEDATYADNVTKMLGELEGVPLAERTARFRTVVLVARPDGTETVVEGVAEGHILTERSGDAGFGYDPIFRPADGDGRTFAEMTGEEKHALSHRGKALRGLRNALR